MQIVITGASRGIGLALTEKLLEEKHSVLGLVRSPEKAKDLQGLKSRFSNTLEISKCDLDQPEFEKELLASFSRLTSIDLLINNAGIYRKGEEPEDFEQSFRINSIAPLRVGRACYSLLKKSASPKIIQITSLMGSIQDNESGGSTAYRASKCALNMMTKTESLNEKWVTFGLIHPGWVQTEMGGKEAPVTAKESAHGIWKVIQKLSAQDSGAYLDFEGERLPW